MAKASHLLQDCILDIPLPAPCKLESKLKLFLTVTAGLTLVLMGGVLGIRAKLGILLRSLSAGKAKEMVGYHQLNAVVRLQLWPTRCF